MTREEKKQVIEGLTEQLNQYPNFYITDIEALNAEQTAALRRKCFEKGVKLVVVKNTLFIKALVFEILAIVFIKIRGFGLAEVPKLTTGKLHAGLVLYFLVLSFGQAKFLV